MHVGNTGVAFDAEWNDSETKDTVIMVPNSSVLTDEHERLKSKSLQKLDRMFKGVRQQVAWLALRDSPCAIHRML